jgi:CBS domain-containing protein
MALYSEVASCSVAEVMGTEMFTLTPETAVASARRLVLENDIDVMLVLDHGTLAGIVCREDLCFADVDARVADCMTSPVLCITPDTTLQEAVDIMGAHDVECLPVVTGAFLVGIVTRDALAAAERDGGDEAPRLTDAPCAACGWSDEQLSDEAAPDLLLCTRCRRLLAANQRC